MKQITLFFFILLPFLGITQQDSSVFYTGRGNLKLSNGKFTITRPNGNLIAVFPNYLLKKQVDSLINNYNDTTDKSGISCVDSLWKVGNIVYHRNWNCDVQSFVIDPPTVDGCSGGRVYHKNILADTSFLTPSPVCGDILVIEGDTCKDLLYIKGNSPSKWNFIGGYLKNSNCFDPLPCKDSVWKVGLTVYYRNVDCFIYTFKDSIGENNDTLYSTLPSSTSYRVTHKPNGSSYFTLKAGTNIEFSDGVIGKNGEVTMNAKSSTADTLFTQTANSSTLKFTHKPAQTTDVTINAGTGINFTNASVGANNVHGTITINADPLPCKDSVWKVGLTVYYRNVDCFIYTFKDSIGENNDTLYSTLPSSTSYRVTHKPNGSSYFTLKAGTNIEFSDGVIGKNGEVTMNAKSSTADTLYTSIANSSQLKFTHKPANTTDVTINAGNGIKFNNASVGANNVHGTIEIVVDSTNSIFKKNYYSVNNIGSGAKVYKNKTTNGDTTQFNLRSVLSNDGTITVTENSNDINISANVNNRDSISHNASIYQFERKDYAKGLYIGGSTFTAGNNIEFSSPVPGPSGSIVINAIDNGACVPLVNSFWTGKICVYDDAMQCIRSYSCPTDPCSRPPALPPPSYQQFNVGSSSVDLSTTSSTSQGYVNFATGDIPSQKSKMNVFINGLKHNYTTSPSAATFLSYTISGTTLTAYSGASPIAINQIEVNIYP